MFYEQAVMSFTFYWYIMELPVHPVPWLRFYIKLYQLDPWIKY